MGGEAHLFKFAQVFWTSAPTLGTSMEMTKEDLEAAIYCSGWVLEDLKKNASSELTKQYFPLCNRLYFKLIQMWSKLAAEQMERSIRAKVQMDQQRQTPTHKNAATSTRIPVQEGQA